MNAYTLHCLCFISIAAAPTQSTTQIQVVTTSTPATTTPSPTIPIITDPPTAATTSAATPGAATTTTELPSTSQIIIITPGTTQSPGTTEQPEVTTTTPRLTTEKLVPFPIGGGGGAVVAPFLGFNPLGLGLGGLGLLFAMGGGMSQGVPFAPAPVLPIASPPRVGPVGFSIPQPFVVQTGGEYPVQRSSWGVEYQQRPPPKGYGRSYRKSYIKSGYGNSYGRHYKRPSYQVNFQVNGVRNTGKNFFELPRNYITAPELGYAKEPDVQITKERKEKTTDEPVQSAYSSECAPFKQTCTQRYSGKEATLYGNVHIFDMICESQCMNGKPECPAEMCACTCPEGASGASRPAMQMNNRRNSGQGYQTVSDNGSGGSRGTTQAGNSWNNRRQGFGNNINTSSQMRNGNNIGQSNLDRNNGQSSRQNNGQWNRGGVNNGRNQRQFNNGNRGFSQGRQPNTNNSGQNRNNNWSTG